MLKHSKGGDQIQWDGEICNFASMVYGVWKIPVNVDCANKLYRNSESKPFHGKNMDLVVNYIPNKENLLSMDQLAPRKTNKNNTKCY